MNLSKLCNMLATMIIVLVIVVCAPLVIPRCLGYQLYGVLSGSMEPVYPVGSVIYVEAMTADQIEVGDPITFKMAANSDVVATHRVIAKDIEKQTFTTKGDNNDEADSNPVSFQRLIGKSVFCIPYLGYVSRYVQSTAGIVAIGAAMILVLALWFLSDYFKKNQKRKSV